VLTIETRENGTADLTFALPGRSILPYTCSVPSWRRGPFVIEIPVDVVLESHGLLAFGKTYTQGWTHFIVVEIRGANDKL
jgi:hypothetical protein